MIENLTDTARQYAQARAAARVARNSPLNALFVDAHHERAHQLATEADGLAARQITAIAAVFAKHRTLSCPPRRRAGRRADPAGRRRGCRAMRLGHTGLRITCSSKPQDEHFRSSSFAPAKPNLGSGRDATRSMWAPQRGQGTGLAVGRADAPSSAATRRSSSSMRASRRFNPIHSGTFSRSLMMSETDTAGSPMAQLSVDGLLRDAVAATSHDHFTIMITRAPDGNVMMQIRQDQDTHLRLKLDPAASARLGHALLGIAP